MSKKKEKKNIMAIMEVERLPNGNFGVQIKYGDELTETDIKSIIKHLSRLIEARQYTSR